MTSCPSNTCFQYPTTGTVATISPGSYGSCGDNIPSPGILTIIFNPNPYPDNMTINVFAGPVRIAIFVFDQFNGLTIQPSSGLTYSYSFLGNLYLTLSGNTVTGLGGQLIAG